MPRQSRLAFALAVLLSPAAMAVDGFLDPTFGQGGLQTVGFDIGQNNWDRATGLAVLPDGRIVLAGVVQGNAQRIGLARLSANGQPDAGFGIPSFLPQGTLQALPNDLVVQTDGKLIIAGYAFLAANQLRTLVCRFEANGTPDLSFATALPNPLSGTGCRVIEPGNFGYLNAVIVQANGAIAMAGTVSTNGVLRGLVARLNAQGNPDNSFDGDGVRILLPQSASHTVLTDISTTAQGDLVAVGDEANSDSYDWMVVRLRGEDGSSDTDFDGNGIRNIPIDLVSTGNDFANAVSVLPNGSVIVGGTADNGAGTCLAVVRLTPTGQMDNSFTGDGLFTYQDIGGCMQNFTIADMLTQSDGNIVFAGNWNNDFFAIRVLRDGGLDEVFGAGGAAIDFGDFYGIESTNDQVYRIANQNGKILMAGGANPNDGNGYDFAVVRLDNDLIFENDYE